MGKKRRRQRVRQEQLRKVGFIRGPKPARPKLVGPDEVLEMPFGRVSRVGRHLFVESNRTPDEQAEIEKQFRDALPRVETEIDANVEALRLKLASLRPLLVLCTAYGEVLKRHAGVVVETDVSQEGVLAMSAIRYLQSLFLADGARGNDSPSAEDWTEILCLVERIHGGCALAWPLADAFTRRAIGVELDPLEEELRFTALSQFLTLRGTSYPLHVREHLERLLAPQNELLNAKWGTTGKQIAEGVERFQHRIRFRFGEAVRTVCAIQNEALSGENLGRAVPLQEHSDVDTLPERIGKLIDATGRRDELDEALATVYGTDAFDVSTELPATVCSALSARPGEDDKFLVPGEFCGWPLRYSMIRRKPFIQLEGKTLCFDPYFTDGLYRAIHRSIVAEDAETGAIWAEAQKSATEEMPIEILASLLPGADVWRSVYYPGDPSAPKNLAECDAIIRLDTLLLVIEVKGGAYTWTSPADDFASHLKSIDSLLLSPAKQATRFISYLESSEEVALYDRERNERVMLRHGDFDIVVPLAVSLDQLAHMAAGILHRRGVPSPSRPTWCVSLDDLRVARDVLKGPVEFFHYLRERTRAAANPALRDLDELDHLGAFLHHNCYTMEFERDDGRSIGASGYQDTIDNFMSHRWADVPQGFSLPPRPRTLRWIGDIVGHIEDMVQSGFLKAGAALISMGGESLAELVSMLTARADEAVASGTTKLLSIFGKVPLAFAIAPVGVEFDETMRRHAYAIPTAMRMNCVYWYKVVVGPDGQVQRADFEALDCRDLSSSQKEDVETLACRLMQRRMEKLSAAGIQVRRNDLCPCGSTLKYKRCHGRP